MTYVNLAVHYPWSNGCCGYIEGVKMKIPILVCAYFLVTGCSSIVMPDEHYEAFSSFAAGMQKCYENGSLDQNLYEQSKASLVYSTSTWIYDSDKLVEMYNQKYLNYSAYQYKCSQVKTDAYELIAIAKNGNANSQAMADSNRSMQQTNNALMQQINAQSNQNNALLNQQRTFGSDTGYVPEQFYNPSACFGPVVNGVCQGTINPSSRSKTCHGKIINGQCIGAVTDGG